ncbi:LysM peptidoglycan-binding domain-containing protein [Ramlibacter sp. H39-3-26]|uniref:LysM peptidoglycan-binding domain-containing protein n=1 Tax=Curvibacter soli TaxID=3031331 RepID=UPI0023DAB9D5|nr:LysM peptidoglycan-binding domain-containing protein [Ramlibacter sp. H39-3-26]MDF1484621.1 LysM peptidoglycan-binding domain-containing protein [Ramlibacter sp. H39-3-26]
MHQDRNTPKAGRRAERTTFIALAAATAFASCLPAAAQQYPVTSGQRSTAQQVAQAGVPLEQLAPDAPDTYVVKRGDTLWAISGIYLHKPWRWPELWGMNLQDIRNPHLIYPGQTLYLLKKDGYARLSTSPGGGEPGTIRVSPRTRYDSLSDSALPTLRPDQIEPFLAEPVVVDEDTLTKAPRIVATLDARVIVSRGDRVYARGDAAKPLSLEPGNPVAFRVFRDGVPLKDPVSGEVLGYEAQYLGRASLVRGEGTEQSKGKDGETVTDIVPGTVDIIATKEEIRVGDRLLPEPEREFLSYAPRAPRQAVDARVVSLYGNSNAMALAGQNQVIVINKGTRDGIERGDVLTLLSDGARVVDRTNDERTPIKLPSEENGHVMVFRTFEKVSYALLLELRVGAKIGDRLVNPR